MYSKEELLQLLRTQSQLPKLLFNIYVPFFASFILKALDKKDEILGCSSFCQFNNRTGFLFLLQDRLLFVNYPFAMNREEVYLNNVATYSKESGIWNTINIADAGGKQYKLFNISEDCANAIIKYLSNKKTINNP